MLLSGILRGGATEGVGFHARVRGTMFVGRGAVTPGPSCECDITSKKVCLLRDNQNLLNNCVTVQWQRGGPRRRVRTVTVPSFRATRECSSPVKVLSL